MRDFPFCRADGSSGAGGAYARLATPSFTPGPGESPLMTWGELEGTPLRLEQEDTPVDIGGSGAGPHFRMPEVSHKCSSAHAQTMCTSAPPCWSSSLQSQPLCVVLFGPCVSLV